MSPPPYRATVRTRTSPHAPVMPIRSRTVTGPASGRVNGRAMVERTIRPYLQKLVSLHQQHQQTVERLLFTRLLNTVHQQGVGGRKFNDAQCLLDHEEFDDDESRTTATTVSAVSAVGAAIRRTALEIAVSESICARVKLEALQELHDFYAVRPLALRLQAKQVMRDFAKSLKQRVKGVVLPSPKTSSSKEPTPASQSVPKVAAAAVAEDAASIAAAAAVAFGSKKKESLCFLR